MSLSDTAKKFEKLKTAIEQDGKIDLVEVNALLDFIQKNNKYGCFEKLETILRDIVKDNDILPAESGFLMWLLDDAQRYIKTRMFAEAVSAAFAAVLVASAIVYICL